MKKVPANLRLTVTLAVLAGLWLLFLGRLAQLTLGDADQLRERGRALQECQQELRPRRGEIYDRHGFPLVTNATTWSLWGNPSSLDNPRRVAEMLASETGEDAAAVAARLDALVPGRRCLLSEIRNPQLIRPGVAARFGLEVVETHRRFYPEGSLACHVLGFVGHDGHGLEGVELEFDRVLRGEPGWVVRFKDGAGGHHAAVGQPSRDPIPGKSVILTIDRAVQEAAEMVLSRAVDRWQALGGSVVILDPATGDILAMANEPAFDLVSPGECPPEWRRNRAVTDVQEPGSTMKLVLASVLLEERLIGVDEMVFAENGDFCVGADILHDCRDYGWLSFREAFEKSSNISFFKLSTVVDPTSFYRAVRDFGFGTPTGVALPGEAAGILRSPESWSRRSRGTIAIGQEVAVTPLQLALAYAAVANDGVLMVPRLVQAVAGHEGEVVDRFPPVRRRRVISPRTASLITSLLERTVASGTGTAAALPGLSVAGKTGTAQKADLVEGGYRTGAYVSSFVGFVPAEDPRFVALVLLDEPQEAYYGGQVAAPAFRELARRLVAAPPLSAKRERLTSPVPSDCPELHTPRAAVEASVMDPLEVTRSLKGAAQVLRRFQGERTSSGRRTVGEETGREPAFGPPLSGENPTAVEVPSLTGLTMREARRLLLARGLQGRLSGTGVVVEQDPSAGTCLLPGGEVTVRASLRGRS